MKKKITLNYPKEKHPKLSQICSYGIFPRDSRTSSEIAVAKEPSVFGQLKIYCIAHEKILRLKTLHTTYIL